jgi:hypothetical protein
MLGIGKTGFALATVMGGYHLCWSILVALGWAQAVIDFVLWAHFIKPIYVVEPFEVLRATILVAITVALGFLLGAGFAVVWNAWTKGRS